MAHTLLLMALLSAWLLLGFVQPRSDVGHQPLDPQVTKTRVAPVDSQLRPSADGRPALIANERPFFPIGVTYHFTRLQGQWDVDLRLMRNIGLNTVRADLSWRDIVPNWEGYYQFAKLDQFLDKAAQHGLYVIPVFSYATGDIDLPWWFWLNYRGWGMVGADGLGPLGGWASFNNQDFRRLFTDYVRETVEHIREHPAILAYQVMNEPHYPAQPLSDYNSAAIEAFREWTSQQHTSVAELNSRWATGYQSFSDVLPPALSSRGGRADAAAARQWRDWREFSYQTVSSFVDDLSAAVRRADGGQHAVFVSEMSWWWWGEQPLTGVSPAHVYRSSDVVGFDAYPESGAHADYYGLNVDLLQHLWQRPVWAMEINRKDGNPTTAEVHAFVASAVERGANGIFYFQWRDSWSDGGAYGLLDAKGNPKQQFSAFVETVSWLRRNADTFLSARVTPPDALVIWPSEAIATTPGDKSPAHDVFRAATRLSQRGLRVGILPEEQAATYRGPVGGNVYGSDGKAK